MKSLQSLFYFQQGRVNVIPPPLFCFSCTSPPSTSQGLHFASEEGTLLFSLSIMCPPPEPGQQSNFLSLAKKRHQKWGLRTLSDVGSPLPVNSLNTLTYSPPSPNCLLLTYPQGACSGSFLQKGSTGAPTGLETMASGLESCQASLIGKAKALCACAESWS